MKIFIIFFLLPLLLFSQTQIGIDIDGVASGDNSGHISFSSDGTIVAIGGPGNDTNGIDSGHVRVFANKHGDWTQIGNDIIGENAGDNFGSSVSLSSDGTIVAIGSPNSEIAGYVSIYAIRGDVWTQIGNDIVGEPDTVDGDGFPTNFSFGRSVSISDNGAILAIAEDRGGTWEGGYGRPGYIHMYENILGTWTQIGGYIDTGISFINKISISDDGSIVAIYGYGDFNCFFTSIGYAKVYQNISGVWTQLGSTFSGVCFGSIIRGVSLSNNGSKIVIGGDYTRVYENIDEEWVQRGETIEAENNYEYFGEIDISNDGLTVAISGYDNTSSETLFGFVRIYKYSSGTWTKEFDDINGEGLEDYYHTMKLSNNGERIAIGSPTNDGNGTNSGHVRVYDLSTTLTLNQQNLIEVKLYPNPTTNQFTLELPPSQFLKEVNIYNNLGQFIQTSQKNTINTSILAPGLYYIEVVTDNGKANKKLVIK